ncbi:S-adenosyl-L-methionine-dependent methyltransferase [Phlyctochytrium arcticum]|nr:S-adenosyl-L-methionine-dependent methyltransferase [Phlyctochytrium arcticum]
MDARYPSTPPPSAQEAHQLQSHHEDFSQLQKSLTASKSTNKAPVSPTHTPSPTDTTERGWSVDKVTEFYASYAEEYDEGVRGETYPAPQVVASWVLEWLEKKDHVNILDLGCGTGLSSQPFFSPPYNLSTSVYGVDATPEMLKQARAYQFKELECADIEKDDYFQNQQFDVIVCVGVLDFVKDMQSLFAKMRRMLQKQTPRPCLVSFTIPSSGTLNAFSNTEIQQLVDILGGTIWKRQKMLGYCDSESGDIVEYVGVAVTIE